VASVSARRRGTVPPKYRHTGTFGVPDSGPGAARLQVLVRSASSALDLATEQMTRGVVLSRSPLDRRAGGRFRSLI